MVKNTKFHMKCRILMKKNYHEHGGKEKKQINYYLKKYDLDSSCIDSCENHTQKIVKLKHLATLKKLQSLEDTMVRI